MTREQMIEHLARVIEAGYIENATFDEIAEYVFTIVSPKPLDWSKKTVECLDDGIKLHLGPYSVRLWSGKLGARLDYLGQPLVVETTANGLSAAIKAAAEAHHQQTTWAATPLAEM